MANKNKTVCFVCLKPFKSATLNNRNRQPPRRSRASQKRRLENEAVDQSSLFQKFSRILTDHLHLPVANLQELTPKPPQNSSAFCPSCSDAISTICDVYKELQVVELRLSSKLGELGELMLEMPKLGVLAYQLCFQEEGKGSLSYVEKLRNLIAFKCATKGREVELHGALLLDKNDGGQHDEASDNDDNGTCKKETLQVIKVEITNPEDEYSGEDDPFPDFDDDFSHESDDDDNELEPQATPSSRITKTKRSEDKHTSSKQEDVKESEEEEPIQTDSDSEWSDDVEVEKKKRNLKQAKKMKRKTITAAPGGRKRKKLDNGNEKSCCQLCNKSFKESEIGRHFYSHEINVTEPDKKIPCNLCPASFAFPQTFAYHLKIRHGETKLVFPCEEDECESSFDNVNDLNSHLKTHSEEIHHCSSCNWGFLSGNVKDLHELTHLRSVRGNYPCPKCGRVLHGFPKFRDHYNLRHGAQLKLHKCSKCKLTFLSRTHLRTHERKHETGTLRSILHPPQCCEVCGRVYEGPRAQELLERHVKSKHASEKELSCNICNKSFEFDRHLDKHIKTEHGLEKLPCSKCDKTLGSTRTLREHMRILHADEPEQHLCPHCGSVFRDFRYLQKHILMQHPDLIEEEGKYDCPDCGKKFRRKLMVKRHLKTCPGKKEETGVEVSAVESQNSQNESKNELSYNTQEHCSSASVLGM